MTGPITLPGDPVNPLQASSKNYVDTQISAVSSSVLATVAAQYLKLSGGTLTGFLTLHASPTSPNHAATKAYVDANSGGGGAGTEHVVDPAQPVAPVDGLLWTNPTENWPGEFLPLAGGTMEGPLVLADDPTNPMEAATKQYVDAMPGVPGPQGPPGPQGDPGTPGATGTPGTPGATGAKGDTGATGSQGPQGTPGTPGSPGAPGEQGPVGATGSQGPPGTTGAQGVKGDKGDTGNTGAQGAPGAQGPQGIQGIPGVAEAWHSGASAPAGVLGAVGDWYLNTTTGDVSEKTGASTWTVQANIRGPQGIQGIQGIQGATGNTGAPGTPGAQGPQGVKGDTGNTGATGSQGPPGTTGAQGPQGVPGPEGIQGQPGDPGQDGAEGPMGPQGDPGPEGPQGPEGPPGESGVGLYLPLAGGTMAGPIILSAEPTGYGMEAVPQSWVWDNFVQLAGSTMTGFLTLHADPTNPFHAATKGYVDTHGGGGGEGSPHVVDVTQPASPVDGLLWTNPDEDAAAAGAAHVVDPVEPVAPVDGLIWTDPSTGITKIWDEDNAEWITVGAGETSLGAGYVPGDPVYYGTVGVHAFTKGDFPGAVAFRIQVKVPAVVVLGRGHDCFLSFRWGGGGGGGYAES